MEAHSDNQTISVLQLSARRPMGWAVSLDENWRGARFHVEPRTKDWPQLCEQWMEVFSEHRDLGRLCCRSPLVAVPCPHGTVPENCAGASFTPSL